MNDKLNVYLSNLAVWTAKLHNIHWNVNGLAFVQVHEFTEKLYDETFEQYDAVAEVQKMQGTMPMVKLSDFLKTATIKEIDAKDFTIEEALKLVEVDMKTMSALAKEIRDEAVDKGDFQVVAMFEDYLAKYAKNLWFLKAMLTK
ncbi:MAG: DNA starvation/stationary phase protection protein [Alphaproteobacteria bacterium]|nr:DNA starvation/stationary phase protection protein [Alphaproteobacteria bacterium]